MLRDTNSLRKLKTREKNIWKKSKKSRAKSKSFIKNKEKNKYSNDNNYYQEKNNKSNINPIINNNFNNPEHEKIKN